MGLGDSGFGDPPYDDQENFGETEQARASFHSPLPPDDRLWRHPSELGRLVPPPAERRRLAPVLVITALVAGLASAGLVLVAVSLVDADGRTIRPFERQLVQPVATSRPSLQAKTIPAGAGVASVEEIAERVRPAIAQVRTGGGGGPSGSGVIFRSDGHLLTNAHVVEGAQAINVVLSNGRELPARLVGLDPDTDAAVVKIDGDAFPVATLGSAADLRVGQQAVAIGFPFGLAGGPSVTVGVVSALHRDVRARTSSRTLFDMVQTDAPIAPGSSGGALLDGSGSVIGITTAIAQGETGSESFGFATPIDMARTVADQLIRFGRVTSTWLGIQGNDLDGATANDLDVDGGALVSEVKPDSPAERGGLVERDVIVEIDGRRVPSMGQLVVALRERRPGAPVTLGVVRDNQRRAVKVVLAERPPES
ncbi:MAG: S1C family serine protease [Acidimicrobiales bacterium]